MAPRKNAKRPEEEPAEVAAAGGDVSVAKKKKVVVQKVSSENVNDLKEVRLPRAAKNKKIEPDVPIETGPVKKPSAKARTTVKKANNSDRDPGKAKVILNRIKNVKEGLVKTDTSKKMKGAEEETAKKSRGKITVTSKRAGTDTEEIANVKPKGRSKKNVEETTATITAANTEKKSAKRGKGTTKEIGNKIPKENKLKRKVTKKVIEQEEEEEEAVSEPQKKIAKGRNKVVVGSEKEGQDSDAPKVNKAQKKKVDEDSIPTKPVAKKGRGKKAVAAIVATEDVIPKSEDTEIVEEIRNELTFSVSPTEHDTSTDTLPMESKENGDVEDPKENGSSEVEEPKEIKKGKGRQFTKKGKASVKVKVIETDFAKENATSAPDVEEGEY